MQATILHISSEGSLGIAIIRTAWAQIYQMHTQEKTESYHYGSLVNDNSIMQ